MTNQPYIDIYKSITEGKLIFFEKKKFMYYLDKYLMMIYLFGFSLMQLALAFESFKNPGIPDKIFGVILVLTSIITWFAVYRKFVDLKLLAVRHDLTKTKVKRLIKELFNDDNSNLILETDNCLILQRKFEYYYKEYTFLIDSHFLYFNLLNFYPKMNPPVVLDHFTLRDQLKKSFDNSVSGIANK